MALNIGILTIGALIASALPMVYIFYKRWKIAPPLSFAFIYLIIFVISIFLFPSEFTTPRIGFFYGGSSGISGRLWVTFGFSPQDITGIDGILRAYTAMFMHMNILHVGGNIIFLIFFGVPFERKVGPMNFVVLYILGGIIGAYMVGAMDTLFYMPPYFTVNKIYIGSSAAIASIMGAYYMYYPRDEIYLPILIIITKAPVYIGVFIYLGFETFLGFAFPQDGIGHFAHITGVFAGVLLAEVMLYLGITNLNNNRTYVDTRPVKVRRKTLKLEVLQSIAQNNYRLKEIISKIENEDDYAIISAWLEKFASTAKCPQCHHSQMKYIKDSMVCGNCNKRWRLY